MDTHHFYFLILILSNWWFIFIWYLQLHFNFLFEMLNQQTKKISPEWKVVRNWFVTTSPLFYYFFFYQSLFFISIPFLLFPWTQFYSCWKLSTIFFLVFLYFYYNYIIMCVCIRRRLLSRFLILALLNFFPFNSSLSVFFAAIRATKSSCVAVFYFSNLEELRVEKKKS